MKSAAPATPTGKQQVPYVRKREHPQFHGIRRSESNLLSGSTSPRNATRSSISRSLTDIWDSEFKRNESDITDSVTRVTVSSDGPTSYKEREFLDEEPLEEETKEMYRSRKNKSPHNIFLDQCAASYYYPRDKQQNNMSSIGLCKSIEKLNCYLKARKDDIRAGVPGKYLHAMISQEVNDVSCFVCPIMYAFFLNETQKNAQLCTVPVINMKREDLRFRTELKWLVGSCQIDEANLVFIDEVDLSYYDQFGNLKLVLLNGDKLSAKQEGLKDALIEIFYSEEVDSQYSWVEKISTAQDGSCCTAIAEKFAENLPEVLAGQGVCKLLLSGILLDTANLTKVNCTSKDKYMTTLLIKGAGRFGCNGLYQILKYKMHDISSLKVREILCREFKKWNRIAGKPSRSRSRLAFSHIGLSSIRISIAELLAREDSAVDEIISFRETEKLRLFMIVSGYYDKQKDFKREILVTTNTGDLMENFLDFLDNNGVHLAMKPLEQLELSQELQAFEVDNKLTSRRSIERLLEEFIAVVRQN